MYGFNAKLTATSASPLSLADDGCVELQGLLAVGAPENVNKPLPRST